MVCAAAAMNSGLRHVTLSRAEDACARMNELAPRVVVVPGTMDKKERARIGAAAEAVDAEVVDLPAVTNPADFENGQRVYGRRAAARTGDRSLVEQRPPLRRRTIRLRQRFVHRT